MGVIAPVAPMAGCGQHVPGVKCPAAAPPAPAVTAPRDARRRSAPPGRWCRDQERNLLMSTTVIQHVLDRLRDIGVRHVFGVPGDYAFPVNDAIAEHPDMQWIGSCNELNAGYSADGYARVHGVGAVCTTYGVGELSAINAIAGAYTDHLPVFHLVGMPKMP